MKYETKFTVPAGFGAVGAVLVENQHHKEIFLKDIVLEGFPDGPVNVECDSWAHSKYDDSKKRIFFANKVLFFSNKCKDFPLSANKLTNLYVQNFHEFTIERKGKTT